MEWVETTGKTVEEAKDLALDQLGVAEDDAEFEVVEEPRAGLFGRVRGSARVRARVRPTQPRPKLDRRDRRRRVDGSKSRPASPAVGEPARPSASGARARPPRVARPADDDAGVAAHVAVVPDAVVTDGSVIATASDSPDASTGDVPRRSGGSDRGRRTREPSGSAGASRREEGEQMSEQVEAVRVGEEAVRFIDGLLAAFGLEGTTELVTNDDELEVRVAGDNLGLLVGPRGTTLQAVQDLTRVAAQRRLGDRETRLRVDVGGYRERRRVALSKFAHQVAADVATTGEARALEPMSSADRKVIHDVLTDVSAVVTHSEGDDPNRRVIIAPANA